jgi:hypothetical protein
VFSNRGFGWKFGGALTLIAGLGVLSSRRGDMLNPALWRCLAEPARWDGQVIWIPNARITSVQPQSYEIDIADVSIRVEGTPPATPGERLGLRATFRAEGPRLVPLRVRALPARIRLRWLVEAISLAALALVLANFSRHFLFRPKVLQVESAD